MEKITVPFISGDGVGAEAVSYTHLDVYKRQEEEGNVMPMTPPGGSVNQMLLEC